MKKQLNHNKRVILEFTLNGHKNTYYRRTDIFGDPITTTSKTNAKEIRETEIPTILKSLIMKYGKESIKDFKSIDK